MSHVTWLRASAPCGRPSCTLRVAECDVDAGCCVLPLIYMKRVAHVILSPAVFVRRYMDSLFRARIMFLAPPDSSGMLVERWGALRYCLHCVHGDAVCDRRCAFVWLELKYSQHSTRQERLLLVRYGRCSSCWGGGRRRS